MSGRYVWGAVLAASLAANIYLFLTRRAAHANTSVEKHGSKRARSLTTIPLPDFAPSPVVATPANYAAIDRAELEQRLERAEARINRLRSPEDKFADQARSPEIESRVKPYLDEVFATYQVKEPKYTFECHGRVCKVDSEVDAEWTLPLQRTFPGRSVFSSMSFGRDGTFIQLHEPDEIPSAYLFGVSLGALLASQKPCAFSKAPRGDLLVAVEFDAARRAVIGTVTGSLAAEPTGQCVKKILDETIAKAAVPPEMTASLKGPEKKLELPIPDE
jgi:hypothetical protein